MFSLASHAAELVLSGLGEACDYQLAAMVKEPYDGVGAKRICWRNAVATQ
jgi:hypothetical protein